MALKKTLNGIEIYLNGKEQLILNLKNMINDEPEDVHADIVNVLIKSLTADVEFLNELKRQLVSK